MTRNTHKGLIITTTIANEQLQLQLYKYNCEEIRLPGLAVGQEPERKLKLSEDSQ